MTDIDELRRLAQAALAGPGGISLNWIKLIQDFQQNAGPATILELLDRLEAAEKERDALRAKIAEMERQEPVAEIGQQYTLLFAGSGPITGIVKRHGIKIGDKLYALPGAQPAPSAPSEEAAAEMGANGGHVVEAERLAFEAWMRGHCWKLGAKWTGTEYRSAFEKGGMVDMHAMRTRELWAAWRDRAALAAAPEAKP